MRTWIVGEASIMDTRLNEKKLDFDLNILHARFGPEVLFLDLKVIFGILKSIKE